MGRVAKLADDGLLVQLPGRRFGRAHVTDLYDIFVRDPLKPFAVGQPVRCAVLAVTDMPAKPAGPAAAAAAVAGKRKRGGEQEADEGRVRVALSLRPARITAGVARRGTDSDDDDSVRPATHRLTERGLTW
jgi:hypothetical protein